jgi:hypothetical protein
MTIITNRIKSNLTGIILILLTFSCQQVQTDWTTEPIDDKHVTWNGSWDNSEKLKLIYQGVKIYDEKDGYEWAFKVKLTYPKNISDDTSGTYERSQGIWTPPNSDLCMPINRIRYEIFDNDDFLIDSMSVKGDCLRYTDTITLQSKKKISKDLISKFKYGKLNVEAGYYLKK